MKPKFSIFAGVFIVLLLSGAAVAQSIPGVFVQGKVTDQNGDGIPGATVDVTCDGDMLSTITEPHGMYLVYFPGDSNCGESDTAYVTATLGGSSGSDSDDVVEYSSWSGATICVAIVDVSIPEFPLSAIPAVLAMGSYLLIRRRSHK